MNRLFRSGFGREPAGGKAQERSLHTAEVVGSSPAAYPAGRPEPDHRPPVELSSRTGRTPLAEQRYLELR
jgi:hypothetical protein